MSQRLRTILGLVAVVGLLLAQQPVSQGPLATNVAPWQITGTGTAGVPGTSVLTVQGISGGQAVPVMGSLTTTFTPSSSSANAFTIKHLTTSVSTYSAVKASGGNLYGLVAYNANSSVCYLQFYNSATPTIGTSVIDSYAVQAGVSVVVPAGSIALENFSTAITIAAATADSGASVCPTAMSVSVYYQ